MTTDYRNKRLRHSSLVAGIALLLMLFGSLLFISGCGNGPTEPKPRKDVAIIERLTRVDTMVVVP